MKRIIDAIKDFLYNITDYGLIVTVIVIMGVILSWRFDILFNRGIEKEVIAQLPEIYEPSEENLHNEDLEEPESEQAESEDPTNTDKPNTPVEEPSGLIATVTIPEGSFPSSIADVLLNSNLIEDKDEFLNRSVELGLDTRLRSGIFEIEIGTPLDNVIKIIANAQ